MDLSVSSNIWGFCSSIILDNPWLLAHQVYLYMIYLMLVMYLNFSRHTLAHSKMMLPLFDLNRFLDAICPSHAMRLHRYCFFRDELPMQEYPQM